MTISPTAAEGPHDSQELVNVNEGRLAISAKDLVSGTMDYAPWAKKWGPEGVQDGLPLAEGFENYLGYQDSDGNDSLGSFVVLSSHLPELTSLLEQFPPEHSRNIPLSIIVPKVSEGGIEAIQEAYDFLARFQEHTRLTAGHYSYATIQSFEIPSDSGDDVLRVQRAVLRQEGEKLDKLPPVETPRIFFEVDLDTIDEYQGKSEETARTGYVLGLKIRTTGPRIHTAETVAHAWEKAKEFGWDRRKATGGLHQPFSHELTDGQLEFGYMNMMVASVVSAHLRSEEEVAAILNEKDPTKFTFFNNGLTWRHLLIGESEIRFAFRSGALTCFGSCSYTEPRDGLKLVSARSVLPPLPQAA